MRLMAAHHRGHRWRGHPGRRLVRYTVRPGDTATGLAVRFHAWTAELLALNHLGARDHLLVGQRLRIPVVRAAARAHHHKKHHHKKRHHKTAPTKAHHTRASRPWRRADASRATVKRVVARTARRHEVHPSLALAVAWQESGWQQRQLSSAGAIGVMQVMPDTGRWMSLYAGRRLHLYGLHDNVTAGVLLLRHLRDQARPRRAVAGYYQGLGGVREHGMYPSTRHYVANVIALRDRFDRGRWPY